MILERLRAATREQHEQLEAALPLSRAAADTAMYDRLLQRFWGFYATWEIESERAASPALSEMLQQRKKVPLLAADLAARNVAVQDLPALPASALPDFRAGEPVLLGSMYVVEGATLGGQIISRDLERQGFRNGHGYSFFQSYGSAAGQQWKVFKALLETVPADRAEESARAARATFEAFAGWFAQAGFTGEHPPG